MHLQMHGHSSIEDKNVREVSDNDNVSNHLLVIIMLPLTIYVIYIHSYNYSQNQKFMMMAATCTYMCT